MNPFRRKAVENAIVAILRDQAGGFTLKSIRPMVAEILDGCSPPEIAAAVQSLRYAGKLAWDRLQLSDSMRISAVTLSAADQEGGAAPNCTATPSSDTESAVIPVAAPGPELSHGRPSSGPDISVSARQGDQNPLELDALKGPAEVPGSGADEAGPDDDDDYPGDVNDEARGPAPAVEPWKEGFRRAGTAGGRHAASTRAGARPVPAPMHEPELARAVREEVNENADRRRRASSTATVRQPLELRKFGIPDMSAGEVISSMLAEGPRDLLAAIERKHPKLWRRCVLLARTRGERPMQVLYAALDRGLGEVEEQPAKAA